ncbi:MAG: DUF6262 family protein [Streptosporangiaceae bacterium]
MTASRPGNPGNLQKAAAARTAATTARAEAALDQMLRTGQPVTFRGLAAAAPVSLDFLYRTPAIRQRVEQLRAQPPAPAAQRRGAGPDQPGNVIAALTGELTQLKRRHREQVAELQHALQAAHGENLMLRRRLGQQPPEHSPADQ